MSGNRETRKGKTLKRKEKSWDACLLGYYKAERKRSGNILEN